MTLAELLVSLAALGLLLAATLALLAEGQALSAWGAARVEAQQHARLALQRMAAEIRQAGLGAGARDWPPVSVAEPTRIVIHQDLDGDGSVTGRGETVTWLLTGDVLRRSAGGGAQPVVNGVRALALTYFDAAGRPTGVPAAVRAVGIELVTEPDHAAPGRRAAARMATLVHLRNR